MVRISQLLKVSGICRWFIFSASKSHLFLPGSVVRICCVFTSFSEFQQISNFMTFTPSNLSEIHHVTTWLVPMLMRTKTESRLTLPETNSSPLNNRRKMPHQFTPKKDTTHNLSFHGILANLEIIVWYDLSCGIIFQSWIKWLHPSIASAPPRCWNLISTLFLPALLTLHDKRAMKQEELWPCFRADFQSAHSQQNKDVGRQHPQLPNCWKSSKGKMWVPFKNKNSLL